MCEVIIYDCPVHHMIRRVRFIYCTIRDGIVSSKPPHDVWEMAILPKDEGVILVPGRCGKELIIRSKVEPYYEAYDMVHPCSDSPCGL